MDSNALYAESIYPILALKLIERNEAISIDGLTPQVAGLLELWFTHLDKSDRERKRLQDAMIEKYNVDYGLAEFELLKLELERAKTLDEKRELYRQARELIGEVGRAVEGLETATNSGSNKADKTDSDRNHDD